MFVDKLSMFSKYIHGLFLLFFVSIGAFISCDYSHMKTKVWDLQNNSQQLGKKANEQI